MHNLYLRKDGRWEGRIRLESDDDIRRYKAFFGRTKKEVESKIQDFIDHIAPPIKACQKDEGREEIYQGRKPQEYSCTPRAFAFLSKLKIW